MSTDRNDPCIKQLTGGVGYVAGRVGDDGDQQSATTPTDQQPISCIKLKLFGNCGVGKTTTVESLRCGYIRALFRQLSRPRQGQRLAQGQTQGQTALQDVESGIANDHERCTRCIDVQRINISGTGNSLLYIC